ncbi:MAG: hypothetical protein H6757_04460 [Candidatus Omnitrophica bacterium]|nr:hypothetical protein [Candidatus Omnitrophota bacterium]
MKTLLLILSLFVLAQASIEFGPKEPDMGQRFGKIIEKASQELQGAALKRPFKLKKMNDSLEKMAEAVKQMARSGKQIKEQSQESWDSLALMSMAASPLSSVESDGVSTVIHLLDQARSEYPQNSFAILLQAIMMNSHGRIDQANAYFEEFLLNSQVHGDFEKRFIKWGDFHMLRRIVYHLLQSRGVSLEEKKDQIKVRMPYEQLLKYVTHPAPEDRNFNLFFVFVIAGGIFILIPGLIFGAEFSKGMGLAFVIFYLSTCLSYGLWIYDLAFGLPFGLTRLYAVTAVLGAGGLLVLIELIADWREKNRPLEKGYKKCPHCREVIVSLSVECSNCRKKL